MTPATLFGWARKAAAMEANIRLELTESGVAILGSMDVRGHERRQAVTMVNYGDMEQRRVEDDLVLQRIEDMNRSLKDCFRKPTEEV